MRSKGFRFYRFLHKETPFTKNTKIILFVQNHCCLQQSPVVQNQNTQQFKALFESLLATLWLCTNESSKKHASYKFGWRANQISNPQSLLCVHDYQVSCSKQWLNVQTKAAVAKHRQTRGHCFFILANHKLTAYSQSWCTVKKVASAQTHYTLSEDKSSGGTHITALD